MLAVKIKEAYILVLLPEGVLIREKLLSLEQEFLNLMLNDFDNNEREIFE